MEIEKVRERGGGGRCVCGRQHIYDRKPYSGSGVTERINVYGMVKG